MRRSPLRRVSRLRAVSPKRAVQNRAYRSLRAAFVTEQPLEAIRLGLSESRLT